MDKKEFLSALEQSLSVLQEDELRDIISEYEQHIDIKVAKGLTEEEAIADFGSFSELTAELLEAYHVRADYAGGKQGASRMGKSRNPKRKGALERKGAPERKISAFWRPFSDSRQTEGMAEHEREGEEEEGLEISDRETETKIAGKEQERNRKNTGILTGVRHKWSEFGRSFGRRDGDRREDRAGDEQEKGEKAGRRGLRRRREGGNMIRNIKRGIGFLFWTGVDILLWGFRLAWNFCWIVCSLITAGFGLVSLFGLGVLAILLMQGYPLVGLTVGCVGLVMCAFSVTVLCLTFLKKGKKSREREEEAEPVLTGPEIFRDQGKEEQQEEEVEEEKREEETDHA